MTQQEIIAHLRALYAELAHHCPASWDALNNSYVAGGAIASMVLDEKVNDYDIWFRTKTDWEQVTACMRLTPTKRTKYSWTYVLPDGKIIQLVKSRIGEPETVVGSFDFKHTQSWFEPVVGVLHCDEQFIKMKALTYNPGKLCHPVNTFQRVLKFARRGYSVNGATIAALMNDSGEKYCEALAEAEEKYADDHGELPDTDWYGGWTYYKSYGHGDEGSR